MIIDELWPELKNTKSDIGLMVRNPNITCAACMQVDEMSKILECEIKQTLSSAFLYDRQKIINRIDNKCRVKREKQVMFASSICFYENALVLRSYTFYRCFSRVFPSEFQHCTILDYYNYIIKIHEIGNE